MLRVGSARARNVLVLMPGTSAGSAYFLPLARWVVSTLPGWQVWSVERRENQLEDQSAADRTKLGRSSATGAFNYYLGWLGGAKVSSHVHLLGTQEDRFAKQWGMAVTVGDLQRVIAAAKARGGKVVLGGHSLGGSVVTAYATWDFGHGRPGAADLAGLVYIDGSSFRAPESAAAARSALSALNASVPLAMADLRRHRRAICRAVREHRCPRLAAGSQLALGRPGVRSAPGGAQAERPGDEPRPVRLRPERRHLARRRWLPPRPTSAAGWRPPGRCTGGTAAAR